MSEDKPKVTTEFNVISEKTITITPINDQDGTGARERTVTFQFGHKVRKKEGEKDKIAGMFKAIVEVVFEGQAIHYEAMAAKPNKALESAIKKMPGSTTMESYEEPNWEEDEFYSQSYTAPKAPEVSLDATLTYEGEEVSLADMLGTAESEAELVEARGADMQRHVFKMASVLHAIWDSPHVKNKFERLEKLIRSDVSGNHSRIAKLAGNGVNALREMVSIAQLAEPERTVLPTSLTSGKGIANFRNIAIKEMVDGAAGDSSGPAYKFAVGSFEDDPDFNPLPEWYGDADSAKPGFSVDTARRFLQYVAKDAGVENALDFECTQSGMDALAEAVDEKAREYIRYYHENNVAHFSTYNKAEYAILRKINGVVMLAGDPNAEGASDLISSHSFRRALQHINKLDMAQRGKDDKIADKTLRVMHNSKMSTLLGFGVQTINKVLEDRKKEAEQKRKAEEVENVDSGISEKARRSYAKASFDEAVQMLANYALSRSDADKVMAAALPIVKQVSEGRRAHSPEPEASEEVEH